jgi:hypothetical protein
VSARIELAVNTFRSTSPDPAALAAAPSRVDLWARAIEIADVRMMAEVGVWTGAFARRILERCPRVERFFMIDPWAHLPDWNKPLNVGQPAFDAVYEEAMRNTDFARDRRTVLRGRTLDVAAMLPDASLDFVYIDGDHTLRGVTIDLQKMLPKVRPGGFIGGDDFSPDPWQHKTNFEPTLVFPYVVFFAEAMDLPVAALPHDQFIIRNSPEEGFSFCDLTGRYADRSLSALAPSQILKRIARQAGWRLGLGR